MTSNTKGKQTHRSDTNIKKEIYTSSSAEETFALASKIGKKLNGGEVLLLIGELGSGKTIFAKGLAHGLEVKDSQEITSPTFTIIHQHQGTFPFYHVDLFRISTTQELYQLGLEEIMSGSNIVAIEWAEKLGPLTPKKSLRVLFKHAGGNKRSITLISD